VRIGISLAALTNRGGIGRYLRLLIRGFSRFHSDHNYIGFIPEFRSDETRKVLNDEGIDHWELIEVPCGNRWAYETRGLPAAVKEITPDIIHGPDYLAPSRDVGCPTCVTVHDLAFRLHPSGMAFKSRLLFRMLAPGAIKHAASSGTVFTDSLSTLKDLRKLNWISDDKGKVVHLACEEDFAAVINERHMEIVCDKYNLPPKYILYVGPIEKRKNIMVLVDAMRIVASVLRRRDEDVPALVAVGSLGAGGEKLNKSLVQASDGQFMHVGYVPREDLPAIYHGCEVFCYPSRYEGFGLPPLEAMTAGKAVIVSNATSLPEVVGDAGILVDPDDTPGWAQAILTFFTNERNRIDCELASIQQSKKFSIEKMCAEVMEGYEKAVSGYG